jgi:hypothetical protein
VADESIGINWGEIEEGKNRRGGFQVSYEEVHRRRKRVIAGSNEVVRNDGFQQAQLSSDGEAGKLETDSETCVYELACGCTVDSLEKARKTSSGLLVCADKHYHVCALCGNACDPGQEFFLNEHGKERTLHKRCAYEYIRDLRLGVAVGNIEIDKREYVNMKRMYRSLRHQVSLPHGVANVLRHLFREGNRR